MKRLSLELSQPEHDKLVALARYRSHDAGRTVTPQECIREWLRVAVVGGTWRPPSEPPKRVLTPVPSEGVK